MTIKTVTIAALSIAAATATADAGDKKFYVSGHYGLDMPAEEEIRGANASGAQRNIDIEFEDGEAFGAALGMVAKSGEFGRVRFEAEAFYRSSDVDQLVLNDVSRRFRPDSNQTTTTVMLNGFYDTPLLAERVRIFAGGGFGIAVQDHDVRYLIERPAEAGGNLAIAIPSSETTWAAQAILGGELVLTPNLSAVADVRFVDFGDTQVERFVLTSGSIDSVLDAENSTTSATIGVRFNF